MVKVDNDRIISTGSNTTVTQLYRHDTFETFDMGTPREREELIKQCTYLKYPRKTIKIKELVCKDESPFTIKEYDHENGKLKSYISYYDRFHADSYVKFHHKRPSFKYLEIHMYDVRCAFAILYHIDGTINTHQNFEWVTLDDVLKHYGSS